MQVEYHNGTGLLCVIGDPIGHSLSPLLQNTMLKELGEDYLYLALPVKAALWNRLSPPPKPLAFGASI